MTLEEGYVFCYNIPMLYDHVIVPAPHKTLHKRNLFLQLVAWVAIVSIFPTALIVHLHMFLYQLIYFSIFDIPKIRFRDYWNIDRWQLHKLNLLQRIGCVYCEYCNGLAAWLKAVVNQTEVYSCAIKHSTHVLGEEHEKNFMPYEKFR